MEQHKEHVQYEEFSIKVNTNKTFKRIQSGFLAHMVIKFYKRNPSDGWLFSSVVLCNGERVIAVPVLMSKCLLYQIK